jgi:hypothetical protein
MNGNFAMSRKGWNGERQFRNSLGGSLGSVLRVQ